MSRKRVFAVVLPLLLAACATPQPPAKPPAVGSGAAAPSAERARVTGTVSYRQRVALPDDAVLELSLHETPRGDAPVQRLANVRIVRPGQVPIRFSIDYDPALVQPQLTYAVRARILWGGRQRFVSNRVYNVITRGAPTHIEMILDMVPGS